MGAIARVTYSAGVLSVVSLAVVEGIRTDYLDGIVVSFLLSWRWYSAIAVPFGVVLDSLTGKVLCTVTVAGAQFGGLLLAFKNGETVLAASVALVALKETPTVDVVVLQCRPTQRIRGADPAGSRAGDDGVLGDGRVHCRPARFDALLLSLTVLATFTVAVDQVVAFFRRDKCHEGILAPSMAAVGGAAN